jgi:hypothetical protein
MTMQERFKARYRGVRVSFGYPACPRLEDQEKLFRLLDVTGTIDVHLTEGYMMEPEASVSALVFHHPEARYFVIAPATSRRSRSGWRSGADRARALPPAAGAAGRQQKAAGIARAGRDRRAAFARPTPSSGAVPAIG